MAETHGTGDEHSALLRVAAACAGANRLEDVLELAAEEAQSAVGAACLSVSRFEADRNELRVLINVGDLSELEDRFPTGEVYSLAEFPLLARMLSDGEPYFTSVDARDGIPAHIGLLEDLGKSSDLGVPIIVEDVIWGEIWTAKAPGEPPFRAEDVSFLELIADQIATAIARAEMFGRVSRLAYEDPLTGLPNRRAFEERLDRALSRLGEGQSLALLVCDVDGLKQINDSRGHAAGDAALISAAEALVRTAAERRGAFAARLAGDEFCVLLEGRDLFQAVSMGMAALDSVRAGEGGRDPISFSCGVASASPGSSASELLAAADSALYAAKRRGGGRVCSVAETLGERLVDQLGEAEPTELGGRLDKVIDAVGVALEGPLADAGAVDRLEVVAGALMRAWNFASWAISVVPPRGDSLIDIANGWNRDFDAVQGMRFAPASEQYPLADYPASAALIEAGAGSFTVSADDPGADPAEVELLRGMRMRLSVTAVATGTEGSFMVEMFGDEETGPVEAVERPLRMLVQAALPPLPADHVSSAASARIGLAEQVTAHARELSGAGDIPAAASVTASHLAAAYEAFVVHVVEREDDEVKLVSEAGGKSTATEAGWRQPLEVGLVGRSLREGSPVLSADVLREPGYRGTEATVGVRSELVVPVFVAGRAWGAINLEQLELDAFADEDISIVEAFAAQLAARLEAIAIHDRLGVAYDAAAEALRDILGDGRPAV